MKKYYFFLFFILIACNQHKVQHFEVNNHKKIINIEDGVRPLHKTKISFSDIDINGKLDLSIRVVEPPDFNTNVYTSIGNAVEIKINNTENEKLNDNVTITLPLKKTIENIPVIGYFNENVNNWEFLRIESYDSLNQTVSFKTNHFSIYMPMEIIAGNGIYSLVLNIESKFKDIRPYMHEGQIIQDYDFVNSELLRIKSDAYLNMQMMSEAYESCKDRASCKLIYDDIPNQISALITSEATGLILTEAVLKGVGGAFVVKFAFLMDNIVTSGIIADCISCFLPNSNLSGFFWENYFTYYIADDILRKNSNNTNISIENIGLASTIQETIECFKHNNFKKLSNFIDPECNLWIISPGAGAWSNLAYCSNINDFNLSELKLEFSDRSLQEISDYSEIDFNDEGGYNKKGLFLIKNPQESFFKLSNNIKYNEFKYDDPISLYEKSLLCEKHKWYYVVQTSPMFIKLIFIKKGEKYYLLVIDLEAGGSA